AYARSWNRLRTVGTVSKTATDITPLYPCALRSIRFSQKSGHSPVRVACPLLGDFVAKVRCRLFWAVVPSLLGDLGRGGAMMGRLTHDQEQFFYLFRLDEAVPDDHPVREIAAVLDLSWVHSELAPYYPRLGRPSIDPVLMIRMLIVGYVFAIRSERALCR